MTTRIRFLGAAGYEIEGPHHRVLIDPFLEGNPVAPLSAEDLDPPDAILVTHAAPDHLGDAGAIAKRTGAPVVCGTDSAALLAEAGLASDQVRATIWGIVVEVGGVVVRPIECHHWSQARLSDGRVVTGTPLSFLIEPESDVRIYHFGDTAIFSGMSLIGQLYRPTVGLLGCTHPWSQIPPGAGQVLTGEMSPAEAALAAEMLGVRLAVASHYEDETHPDVLAFLDLVPGEDSTGSRRALAPAPGETIVIAGDTVEIQAT